MKLDAQQKIILTFLALLFLTAVGSLVFIHDEPEEAVTMPVLITSTPANNLTSSGWWDSIPTDPALPTMPVPGKVTATPILSVSATLTQSP